MAKRLSEKDLKQYHQGMYDIDYILGTTKILFYPFINPTPESLYNEKKRAKYGDPIHLTGRVSVTSVEAPYKDSNIKTSITTVNIPNLAFTKYTYVEGDEARDHPPLDPHSLTNGVFYIEGKKYEIRDCNPEGLFADTFTSYKYECVGVDKL